jgi:hypothetical protein
MTVFGAVAKPLAVKADGVIRAENFFQYSVNPCIYIHVVKEISARRNIAKCCQASFFKRIL